MSTEYRPIVHSALSLSESQFLKHYKRGRFRTWNGVAMTGSELPGPGFNFAACLGSTPALEEILPVVGEFFHDAAEGWGILVEGGAGHSIEAELRFRGWAVAEDEPAFVIPDLGGVVASHPRPQSGLTLLPLRSEPDRKTFQRIAAAAFETTAEFADMIMPNLGFATDPAMYWVVGSKGDEPVAAGGYYVAGPTAVVCCLATLHAHRGKGYGAEVTRHVLAHAFRRGCRQAALRSGPASVPLYERLGFRYVCQHRTYAAPPVS